MTTPDAAPHLDPAVVPWKEGSDERLVSITSVTGPPPRNGTSMYFALTIRFVENAFLLGRWTWFASENTWSRSATVGWLSFMELADINEAVKKHAEGK